MNVAQVQSQYETAAAQIPQIELQIAQTENALSILLGRNPGPIARGKSIDELALPTVPAGLPSQLLERRPDLMQSEQQLVAANAQIGAAKALYFPTISLTGAFGSASSDLSNLFTGPARIWSYAGQIVGPIFTFGAVSGQVAQAEARPEGGALQLRAVDPERVRRRRQCAHRQPEAAGAARRASATGRGAAGLFAACNASNTTAATRRIRPCSRRSSRCSRRELTLASRARAGVQFERQHLQSDGRRLGRTRRHRRPRVARPSVDRLPMCCSEPPPLF